MARKNKGEVSFWWGFKSPVRLTNEQLKARGAKREGTSKVGGVKMFNYVIPKLFEDR